MTSAYERILAQQKAAERAKVRAWAKIMGQKMPEVDSEWHPRDGWPSQDRKIRVTGVGADLEADSVWFSFSDEDGVHCQTIKDFYADYYEAEEWDAQIQERFPKVFAKRAGDKCECCPSLSLGGVLSYHHRKRSSKEFGPANILSRHMIVKIGEGNWPEPVVPGRSDEDVLLSEMKKCVPVCRKCHDHIHKAEKKVKNPTAYRQYIDSLKQFGQWLNIPRIEELARLSPE